MRILKNFNFSKYLKSLTRIWMERIYQHGVCIVEMREGDIGWPIVLARRNV
jgi:hypothetical protein